MLFGSPACSIKPLDNTQHKLEKGRPVLWTLSNQSFPEIVEGPGGEVVGMTRV